MAQKGRGKGKGPELLFDETARAEYLTGFRKRKQERKQAGREYLAKKAKEEQLAARKELRQARKEKAAENVREQRKAFGLQAEGESDIEQAAGSGDEDDAADQDAVPQVQEEEYDSDQHHTHVVVEAFDPEQEAFAKATSSSSSSSAAAPTPSADRKPKANGASTSAQSSVEALPPSSRRVNKAKANASLPLLPPSSAALPTPLSSPCKNLVLTARSPPSPLALSPAGASQETHHPHKKEDVAQKRILISGLTESFSKEDLVRRFATFGSVLALDGLGKRDALGHFRPYAYLTLRAPPAQIQRCMNLLSGSVWKGATLRIGEAKPDYHQRIQHEIQKRKLIEEQERSTKAKKHKRLPPGMGIESASLDPVDEAAVESGAAWGWKRTPAGHLVRPLRMRPAHPLPRPSRASTLAQANAKESDDQPESSRPPRVNPRPPTRAHRITIDPTRYGAIHLSGSLLESLAAETGASSAALDLASLGAGSWSCQEIDDEHSSQADASHRLVRWQYLAKDGAVLHEEFTKLPVRVVAAGHSTERNVDVVDQLDFDRYSDAASDDDLFSGFASALPAAQAAVQSHKPRAVSRHAVDTADIDDLFAHKPRAIPTETVDTTDIDDLFAGLPSSSATGSNDLFSDLPSARIATPSAKRAKVVAVASAEPFRRAPSPKPKATPNKGSFVPGLDPEEEDPANFSDGYDEGLATVRDVQAARGPVDAAEERNKTLALLGEMFGSASDGESPLPAVDAVDAPAHDAQEVHEAPASSSSDSSSESDSASSSDADSDSVAQPASEQEKGDDGSGSNAESDIETQVQPDEAVEQEAEDVGMEDAPIAAADEVAARVPMDGKARRAAFLRSLSTPAGADGASRGASYMPIARFDPGTTAAPASAEAASASVQAESSEPESQPTLTATAKATGSSEAGGSKVSMSTLKAMFKPQDHASVSGVTAGFSLGLSAANEADAHDASAGFSLLDSLGLDLELEEEEQEPEGDHAAATPWSRSVEQTRYAASFATQEGEATQRKLAPFFPSAAGASGAAWNGAEGQGSVLRWLRPRSDEQRQRDWERYKQHLTKAVKKRHREAARKHKRNFTTTPNPQRTGTMPPTRAARA